MKNHINVDSVVVINDPCTHTPNEFVNLGRLERQTFLSILKISEQSHLPNQFVFGCNGDRVDYTEVSEGDYFDFCEYAMTYRLWVALLQNNIPVEPLTK